MPSGPIQSGETLSLSPITLSKERYKMDCYHVEINSLETESGIRYWVWKLFTYDVSGTLLATSKHYKSNAGAWAAGGRLYEALKSGKSSCTFSWRGRSGKRYN